MFPTYGFVFIAVLIIASGLIAYLGDVLGRRMGRKRLTLWGLRPRYTAMVMSIVAGIMITVVTLGAAMTVSDKVRDGLTQIDKVRSDITTARSDVARLEGERAQAIDERDGSRREAEAARGEAEETKSQLTQVQQQLSDVRGELRGATASLKRTQGALETAETELKATRGKLASVREDLGTTRNELRVAREELAVAREDLAVTREELADTKSELENKAHELENAEDLLIRTYEEYRTAERERDRATRERDAAIAERDEAAAEAARWKVLGTKVLTARAKRAIFAPDEPIMSTSIDGGQSLEAIRSLLDKFVGAIDERAREAGAAGTDTDSRSVVIFKFERDPETGEARPAAPERVLDALARSIQEAAESTLVQAYSVWTGLEGEQTPIDFSLYRNRLVFAEGEEIARAPFDSGDDQVKLLLQLVGLLQQQVGARARERGVMPVAARWLPGEPVITSPPTVVGGVSLAEVDRVLSEIKSRRAEVELVVRAAKDTYTAGPLDVALAVESGG